MNHQRTLRQVGIALMLLVVFLVQGTWALAGTTGGLYGTVTDTKAAPVAGATVTAASPSGTSTTTTDASGTFRFLSLTPDTYTVSVDKSGFSPASQAGVTVFADNQQSVNFRMTTLREIGSVTSRSSNTYVKSGTTNDVYSVNAATQEALQGLGGGGNLNSAYSAVYGTPGVTSYTGNYGFGQVFYIRGGSYDQSGYEYDGVPVNRAFDNYNSSTESNLGLQELQVYTGGGPSSNSSSGTAGVVNHVIKTGTCDSCLSWCIQITLFIVNYFDAVSIITGRTRQVLACIPYSGLYCLSKKSYVTSLVESKFIHFVLKKSIVWSRASSRLITIKADGVKAR